VLVDRTVGLLGLVFVAAIGATVAARMSDAIGPLGPGLLWAAFAGALAVALPLLFLPHSVGFRDEAAPCVASGVGRRANRAVDGRADEVSRRAQVDRPRVSAAPIVVQGVFMGFYWSIAHALGLSVPVAHLAILVPISFVVQHAAAVGERLGRARSRRSCCT
jgi:hypothetical protein